MQTEQSITRWIKELKDGDPSAARRLWEEYFGKMADVARHRMRGRPKAVADEEDVALSAFHSFCTGLRDGRFPRLTDRTNLWPLLVTITGNKSVDLIRRENRQKRGGPGKPVSDSDNSDGAGRVQHQVLNPSQIISRGPTPEFAVEMAEQLQHLLDVLDDSGDSDLGRIACWRLEGETTTEIAERLGCVRRTVERKLKLIVRLWNEDSEP